MVRSVLIFISDEVAVLDTLDVGRSRVALRHRASIHCRVRVLRISLTDLHFRCVLLYARKRGPMAS